MQNKKEILAIIPARAGSKGIPNKNIIDLAGKPLIWYSINEAKKAKYISRIIISTDGKEIAEVAKKYNCEVIKRPKELAEDKTPTLPVLKHAVNYLKEKENYSPDIIVLLQPTSPLRKSEDIDKCIEKLLTRKYDSIATVSEPEHNPEVLVTEENDYAKFLFSRRPLNTQKQNVKSYFIDGVVYVCTLDCLMKNADYVLGDKIGIVIIDKNRSIEIDTIKDLEVARAIIEYEKNKNSK